MMRQLCLQLAFGKSAPWGVVPKGEWTDQRKCLNYIEVLEFDEADDDEDEDNDD